MSFIFALFDCRNGGLFHALSGVPEVRKTVRQVSHPSLTVYLKYLRTERDPRNMHLNLGVVSSKSKVVFKGLQSNDNHSFYCLLGSGSYVCFA